MLKLRVEVAVTGSSEETRVELATEEAQPQRPDETSESAPAQPAIEVRNLVKAFGHFYALNGVNLSVAPGEFWTIFGPNGAGKTTLIRILSTLSKASSGTVTLAGFSVRDDPLEVRRRIGVIGHQPFLYDDLTARENLLFYGRMYRLHNLDVRVDLLLDEVGLTARAHDRVRTYSRGMVQRLAIARALLHEPQILLLDEPYTGLDQIAASTLTERLRQLHTERRTILMTTHNLDQGLEIADQVAILVRGKLRYQKKRSEINTDEFGQTYWELVSPHEKRLRR